MDKKEKHWSVFMVFMIVVSSLDGWREMYLVQFVNLKLVVVVMDTNL